MTRNVGFQLFPCKEGGSSKSQTTRSKQELNRPVAIEEFDRERMGLAARSKGRTQGVTAR